MFKPSVKRALPPQFESVVTDEKFKMKATAQHPASSVPCLTDYRQVITPATLTFTPGLQVGLQQAITPSPASTESLIGRILTDFALPLGPNTAAQTGSIPP